MGNESNMIAACPKCRARYRIEAGRLQPEGVRLRCSQCDAVFRVTPPPAAVAAPPAVEVKPAQPESPAEAEPPRNAGPVVVLADSDIDAGKRTAQALADWGYSPVLVHDGVEAILTVQRQLPQAVVLDAGLTKMFGFQVCELMKRNESLSSIHVVLIGAIHHETRYRREPSEIYGADAYLERQQLPEALRAVLRGFGLNPGEAGTPAPEPATAPRAPERAPEAARTVAPGNETSPAPDASAPDAAASGRRASDLGAAPSAPPALLETEPAVTEPATPPPPGAAAPVEPEPSEEHAAAKRLARIIVSDIVLYNAEKFDAGVRSGDVLGALASELDEARTLLAQRVAPKLREECDFVAEELIRVARSRGMGT